MLTPVKDQGTSGSGAAFAIVASEYNARYVDGMLEGATRVLKSAGAQSVRIIRVPGAYEVPLVTAVLARAASEGKTQLDAVICLGVILRGETTHAAHIGEAVSRALMDLQLRYEVPLIHEVLLLENHQQAVARCLDPEHNRGAEAAQTALAMAQVLRQLRQTS